MVEYFLYSEKMKLLILNVQRTVSHFAGLPFDIKNFLIFTASLIKTGGSVTFGIESRPCFHLRLIVLGLFVETLFTDRQLVDVRTLS